MNHARRKFCRINFFAYVTSDGCAAASEALEDLLVFQILRIEETVDRHQWLLTIHFVTTLRVAADSTGQTFRCCACWAGAIQTKCSSNDIAFVM